MAVRAKFKVTSINRQQHGEEVTTIQLAPVYANNDPNHENSQFWKYTPSGKIELGCVNPAAVQQFELGKEYYVDFTPAPTTQS